MDKLLTRTPGLEKTHQIYTRFTRDERRRELALAREKAIRDEADHLEYAIDKGFQKGLLEGEAIGLEKGLEQGELKAKAEAVSMLLEMKFPEEFTVSDREKIQRVADLNRLDELMKVAIFGISYSEIVQQI